MHLVARDAGRAARLPGEPELSALGWSRDGQPGHLGRARELELGLRQGRGPTGAVARAGLEDVAAAGNDANSFAVKRKNEQERIAMASR